MKRRIAVLALAVGFLAAPGLGVAALGSCLPCCPQPANAPCETGEAPCASLTDAPCCQGASAVPASGAKRSIDPPNLYPAVPAVRSLPPVSRRARLSQAGGDLPLLTSPLRLSVVLLI